MALLVSKNCVKAGATLTSALVAATAGGDTYDRYADFLIVNNGSGASITVTITPGYGPAYTPLGGVATNAGSGTPFTVTVAAGVRETIGLGANTDFGSAGGSIAYSASATVTVGSYYTA